MEVPVSNKKNSLDDGSLGEFVYLAETFIAESYLVIPPYKLLLSGIHVCLLRVRYQFVVRLIIRWEYCYDQHGLSQLAVSI